MGFIHSTIFSCTVVIIDVVKVQSSAESHGDSGLVHHSLCRTLVGRTHEALPPAVELLTKLFTKFHIQQEKVPSTYIKGISSLKAATNVPILALLNTVFRHWMLNWHSVLIIAKEIV